MEKLFDASLVNFRSTINDVRIVKVSETRHSQWRLIDIFSSNYYLSYYSSKMRPDRPQVVNSSRNYITLSWNNCDSLRLKVIAGIEGNSYAKDTERLQRWFVLEKKNRVLGWCAAYMGFKTHTEVGPLAPGDYYEFRLKVTTGEEESDWSDTLFAVTRDDTLPAAQLHRAVENGPVTTLRKILNQRHSAVNIPNKFGQTPLRLAILKNNLNFMGILLNHGADIENPEPGSGRTPLMTAAQRGQLEAMQLLLEKCSSWETKDRNGLTALNYAVDSAHLEAVRFAVENGANIKVKDNSGWTVLMRGVILKTTLEVLTYLLSSGSDPNEVDDRRQTVLMHAVLSGRPEVVELLLKSGADIKVMNVYGHSAYDMAKSSPNEEIIKIASLLGNEVEEDLKNKEKKRRAEDSVKPSQPSCIMDGCE